MVYCAIAGLEPLQFNWFRAVMRLDNSLTRCNTMKKVLQADIQLSTRSCDFWSSYQPWRVRHTLTSDVKSLQILPAKL